MLKAAPSLKGGSGDSADFSDTAAMCAETIRLQWSHDNDGEIC